jgi:hypothetical protein
MSLVAIIGLGEKLKKFLGVESGMVRVFLTY